MNVILFIFTIPGTRIPPCCQEYYICLWNMGFMAYFRWIIRRDRQMSNLVKVTLVKELFEWDIHYTPQHPSFSNFENMRDDISQHTTWRGWMGELVLFHGLNFLGFSRNHENFHRWLCILLAFWIILQNASIKNSTYNDNNTKIIGSWITHEPLR